MIDLSTFGTIASASEGAVMTVNNPATGAELRDTDGQPITITLAGADSERVRAVNRKAQNKRLAQQRGGRSVLTAESLEAEGLNALVAGTIAWSGIVLGGQALDLNDENARRVYTELPWLRRQVDEFMADAGNYAKPSPQS